VLYTLEVGIFLMIPSNKINKLLEVERIGRGTKCVQM